MISCSQHLAEQWSKHFVPPIFIQRKPLPNSRIVSHGRTIAEKSGIAAAGAIRTIFRASADLAIDVSNPWNLAKTKRAQGREVPVARPVVCITANKASAGFGSEQLNGLPHGSDDSTDFGG
ncbi:hypothetical protein [Paenibacillus albus]|uniref:Uncharacterized protein n=1 Tax=Paenibacillus albus TaxID=2495582 RepID=A0A3Q8X1W1_9BACL|nr:hypothetical protein [Paenibacillus albus]AZN38531.1 hypothetical protein EJC50_01725 [Paenibacillus albus]